MKAFVNSFLISLAIALCMQSHAQISEPPPMAGTFGAGQAATHYAMMNKYTNGASSSCEEKTQWKAHMAKRNDCRRSALAAPAGKQRSAIRGRCDAMYPKMDSPSCGR
jgi:hypothetical protein